MPANSNDDILNNYYKIHNIYIYIILSIYILFSELNNPYLR